MNKKYLPALGNIKSVIIEELTDMVVNINGIPMNKIIELSDITGSSVYNRNCRSFVEIILFNDNGDDLDDYTDEDIKLYLEHKRLKHIDMWYNEEFRVIKLLEYDKDDITELNEYYTDEEIKLYLKLKYFEETKEETNLNNTSKNDIKIRKNIIEQNKHSFLNRFYEKIPTSYLESVIKVLNSYDINVIKEYYNCISTTFNDKLLDKETIIKYLYIQLNKYHPLIFSKQKNLLKDLHLIDNKGIGRLEILMSFLIDTLIINGGTLSYDASISFSYEDQNNYFNIEIKAPDSPRDPFRLGLKGKLPAYSFYRQINDIVSDSIKILNQFGLDEIKIIFKNNSQLYECFKKITSDEFNIALKDGELSSKFDKIFKPYCGFLAEFINNFEHLEIYENRLKNTLHTKQLKNKENIREILSIFKNYSFIQTPNNIHKIINDELQNKVYKNIDFMIISRDDKIRILDKTDLSFSIITQGGCKGIETEILNEMEKSSSNKKRETFGYKFLVENSWNDFLKKSYLFPEKHNTFTSNYIENLSLLKVC